MDLNFRADVNAPEWCDERQRALFYAICAECDQAGVKLEAAYQIGLALFASVLSNIETHKLGITGNAEQGQHIVALFERFLLALGLAEDFQLNLSALGRLILVRSPEALAAQKAFARDVRTRNDAVTDIPLSHVGCDSRGSIKVRVPKQPKSRVNSLRLQQKSKTLPGPN